MSHPERGPAVTAARLAVLLDLAASALALLFTTRGWQTVTAARPRPLADEVVQVSGRQLDGAGFALALVALAGAVALLATRGLGRRVVGAVVALAGVGLAYLAAATGFAAMGAARAATFVAVTGSGVGVGAAHVAVSVRALWPVLTVVCGLAVAAAGVITVVTGDRWRSMSSRYEAPKARAGDDSLWQAIDRGEDPTHPPSATGQ